MDQNTCGSRGGAQSDGIRQGRLTRTAYVAADAMVRLRFLSASSGCAFKHTGSVRQPLFA